MIRSAISSANRPASSGGPPIATRAAPVSLCVASSPRCRAGACRAAGGPDAEPDTELHSGCGVAPLHPESRLHLAADRDRLECRVVLDVVPSHDLAGAYGAFQRHPVGEADG